MGTQTSSSFSQSAVFSAKRTEGRGVYVTFLHNLNEVMDENKHVEVDTFGLK